MWHQCLNGSRTWGYSTSLSTITATPGRVRQRRVSLMTKSEPPGTSLLLRTFASLNLPIAPIRSNPWKRSSELPSAV